MGSSDGIKEALEKLTAEIKDLKTAQQEIKSSLDKLAPIVPVVDQLAAVPSKVITLQSAAFDNAEQVRALNLALIRVENLQREGKAAVVEEADASDHSANFAPKAGSKQDKPPPECTRDWRTSPAAGTRTRTTTTVSTHGSAWNFRRSTARRSPSLGSIVVRPSSGVRARQRPGGGGTPRCISPAWHNCGMPASSSRRARRRGGVLHSLCSSDLGRV
jgi:hypothetical protein